MKYFIQILLLVGINISGFSAFEQNEGGARSMALGGAFVGLANNPWAIYYNPAGISNIVDNEMSIFFLPQQFGLMELSTAMIAGNYKSKVGAFGFGLRKFGFNLYKEISGCLSYSNEVFGINVGINLNYYSLTIAGYGRDAAIGVDVGVLFPLVQNLQIGMSTKNINMPTLGERKEKLPQIFSTGISYSPVENLVVVMDYYKEVTYEGSFRFGTEYKVFDFASLRVGAANQPAVYSLGAGVEYKFIQLDYSFCVHQELGITHAFSITLKWGGADD
jgi:hypothetical protein